MRQEYPVPDDKQAQRGVFDDPALLDFNSKPKAGYTQSFDPRTGAGAQSYSRQQARASLASKVKTTGQQGAEDWQAVNKELYGPYASDTVEDATRNYGATMGGMYAGSLLPGGNMLKGAAGGAGLYIGENAIRGKMPTLKGTAIAAGGGAVAAPLMKFAGGLIPGRLGRLINTVRGVGGEAEGEATTIPSRWDTMASSSRPGNTLPAQGATGPSPFSGSRAVVPGITSPTPEEALSGALSDVQKELPTPQAQPDLITGETAQQTLNRQSATTARHIAEQAEKSGARIPKPRLAQTVQQATAPSEGSAIVTPAQQAEDVGRFYAGGGPGGGQGGGPNPYVTEQNRRLIQKIIDEGRNPPGIDPMLKSARRHYTKGSE